MTTLMAAMDAYRCAWCDEPGYLTAYWGDVLCQACAHYAAHKFDNDGRWPPQPKEDTTQ